MAQNATNTLVLTKIGPASPSPENRDLRLQFETSPGKLEDFTLPYLELRFECPCASCVDEITGRRTLKKESLKPDVKPRKIEPVGNYGIHVDWSDGHRTGMYHFDKLYQLAQK
jgi:DUF971 family protein